MTSLMSKVGSEISRQFSSGFGIVCFGMNSFLIFAIYFKSGT
jgi:hypothetical protein